MEQVLNESNNATFAHLRLRLNERLCILAEGVQVRLPPIEFALYRLFLSHPEGIRSSDLRLHRDELAHIYGMVSKYDDQKRQRVIVDTLCSRPNTAIYVFISRIKKRFVAAMGVRRAGEYIIRRNGSGLYRIPGCIKQPFSVNNSK